MKSIQKANLIDTFFKDRRGHWQIIQFPNVLLTVWIILVIANSIYSYQSLRHLQDAVLFAWAYMELTQGSSNFRKVLGAVVLIGVIIGFLM